MRLLASLLGLLNATAHAQPISGAASGVAGDGMSGALGSFAEIVVYLRGQIWPILIVAAGFLIVRAGLKLINSQDEGKLETAKRTIASALVGLMLVPLADRIFLAIFNPSGYGLGDPTTLTTEIGGIINWTLVLIVPIAILMIVVSGIRAVASFGKEDGATQVRQAVYGVVLGIGILLFAGAIKATLGLQDSLEAVGPEEPGPTNSTAIIMRGVEVASRLLQFLALIAVAVIIYAGILMVLNFGKDDQYERAKGIVFRAAIGLVVVLLANVIVLFVANILL